VRRCAYYSACAFLVGFPSFSAERREDRGEGNVIVCSMLRLRTSFSFFFFVLGFLEEKVILFYDATVYVIKCIYTSIKQCDD